MFYLLTFLFSLPIAFAFYLWRFERSHFVRQIDRIPGPPKVPFFGNVFDIPRDGSEFLHKLHVTWVEQYGRVYRIWRITSPIISISSPHHIQRLLTSQINIDKSSYYAFLEPWLGKGLLSSSGDKWRKDRRLLTPAFHFQILGDFCDVFFRNAEILVEQILNRLADCQEIDIYPLISRCTLDVICEAAMGIQMNTQTNNESEYIYSADRVQELMRARFYSPLGVLPNWVYLRLTQSGRELKKNLNVLHRFTKKVLEERKKEINQDTIHQFSEIENEDGIKKRRPFLDLLLITAIKNGNLSESDILSQVDTFMFAGHDTTATAIVWFLYCMATNLHEQEKVYEELRECFDDSNRPCTYEDLSQLKYLECCLKESMRLHPSVATFRRQISEEIQFDDYTVPVGASVLVQIYALHHNQEVFPEPLSFKPERFQKEESVGRHPFAFIPFSGGPRNCIGQRYAHYEEKVILIALMRKFHFSIDPKLLPVKKTHGIVVKPVGGMKLKIKHR